MGLRDIVTGFGLLLTPVFYVVIRGFREKHEPAENAEPVPEAA